MIRTLRVIGNPAAALGISVPQGHKVKFSKALLVVARKGLELEVSGREASLAGPAEFVLATPDPPTVIDVGQEKWTVNPRYLVAWDAKLSQNAIQGPGQMALSGSGGVFRVDVGDQDEFVVEQDRLVAHNAASTTTVYRESRLDAFSAWGAWAFHSTKRGFYRIVDTSRRAAAKVQSWGQKTKSVGQSAAESLQAPSTTPAVAQPSEETPQGTNPQGSSSPNQAWKSAAAKLAQISQAVQKKTFFYTHDPKVAFTGPCSVLVSARANK